MEKRSKNPYDVAVWIERVINSGTDPRHNAVSRCLVNQFAKVYRDKIPEESFQLLVRELRVSLESKKYT